MTILIGQTRERIKMRPRGNHQPVAFERRFELTRLKVVVQGRAGEDGDTLRRIANAFLEVSHDPYEVFFEAGAFFTLQRIGLDAFRELFADERQEVAFAVFVHARVEIETDNWR